MPYKDKEAQREYNKERMRKARQGSTEQVTQDGVAQSWYPKDVLPGEMTKDQKERYPNIPLPFGEAYYKALAEQEGIEVNYEVKSEVREPAIAEALVDPIKRSKLEKVYTELKGRGLLQEVRYGVAGPTFDVVGELLEVTH